MSTIESITRRVQNFRRGKSESSLKTIDKDEVNIFFSSSQGAVDDNNDNNSKIDKKKEKKTEDDPKKTNEAYKIAFIIGAIICIIGVAYLIKKWMSGDYSQKPAPNNDPPPAPQGLPFTPPPLETNNKLQQRIPDKLPELYDNPTTHKPQPTHNKPVDEQFTNPPNNHQIKTQPMQPKVKKQNTKQKKKPKEDLEISKSSSKCNILKDNIKSMKYFISENINLI